MNTDIQKIATGNILSIASKTNLAAMTSLRDRLQNLLTDCNNMIDGTNEQNPMLTQPALELLRETNNCVYDTFSELDMSTLPPINMKELYAVAPDIMVQISADTYQKYYEMILGITRRIMARHKNGDEQDQFPHHYLISCLRGEFRRWNAHTFNEAWGAGGSSIEFNGDINISSEPRRFRQQFMSNRMRSTGKIDTDAKPAIIEACGTCGSTEHTTEGHSAAVAKEEFQTAGV